MALNQMLAMKYVKPFKSIVLEKSALLSGVNETVEQWLKVQNLWTGLVAVFTGGDIAKQMPQESKKF